MSHYVDLEIVHTLPFSNANRDDAGQPKTVVVGGVPRGRLSSQSLKRAARFFDAEKIDGFGLDGDTSGGSFFRTRYLKDILLKRVSDLGGTEEDLARVGSLFGDKKVLGAIKEGSGADTTEKGNVLIVITRDEITALAQAVLDGEVTEEDIVRILQGSAKRDIALWGRFFASSSEVTLDGSAQVAHAFTTHAVNIEPDFFVGLDDAADLFSNHAGAGHPGDSFYLTGTFYKYANFNVEETVLNLLNARVQKGELVTDDTDHVAELVDYIVDRFIRSFTLSVPQGKVRSTAHQTLPSLVRVSLRSNRPVNAATAFDNPVRGKNIPQESVERLASEHADLEAFVGAPDHSFYLCRSDVAEAAASLGERSPSLDELVRQVRSVVRPVVESILTRLSE